MVLSEFDKGRVVGMREAGMPIAEVARRIPCQRRIARRWWLQYQETGNVTRQRGSGRPRLGSDRDDRRLIAAVRTNRFTGVPRLMQMIHGQARPYSIRTALRRCHQQGYMCYRPAVRIPLSPHHRQLRLQWCQERSDVPMEYWHRILWTDESRFCLDFHDGRVRVRRLPTERLLDACIAEHDRYGGGSIMIWGGIWHGGRSVPILVNGTLNGERYVETIVRPVILPTAREHGLTLQQDNARPHTCRLAQDALNASAVPRLLWTARSPDLSPIEHVWDIIQRRLQAYQEPPATLQRLAERVLAEWDAVPQEAINHLIDSMPRRVAECITRNGGHTSY